MTTEQTTATLIELDGSSGKLQASEAFPGYIEFVPTDEVKERIEKYLAAELTQAIEDRKPLFDEARENTETYRAKKQTIDGLPDILPSPLARIAADQNIAQAHSTIMRPNPLLSVKPYFPATYDVMLSVPVPGPDGQQTQAAVPMPRDADKIAKTWELGYEYILRERVKLSKKLQQILTDTVTGAQPCWGKVCYHAETRTVMEPVKAGFTIDLSDKREAEMPVGDPVKWVILPTYNVLLPVEEDDVQASPWIAEPTPLTSDDYLLKYYSGDFPLLTADEEAEKLSKMAEDTRNDAKVTSDETVKQATVRNPRLRCNVFEVWLYWDVKIPNPNDPKRKLIKRLSLLTTFHLGPNKLLSCFRNPYDHQLRPYVPFFQIEDPHTLSGSSTVGIVKWHQKVKTRMWGLELENAASANNMSAFADPDTEAFAYLSGRKKLLPNEVIPKREDEYVEMWRKGESHFSLMPNIQYVDNDGMRAVNMSSIELGADVPNRTPSGTVSQVMQQGNLQNLMFLRTICERLVEMVKLDLRTRRQFYPTGETLHVFDKETQQLLEVLFQFPVEDAIDNFRFAFTAADEEMAKEHELPQLMALQANNQKRGQWIAQVVAPIVNPNLLPSQVQLFVDIVASDQVITDKITSLFQADTKKFDYTQDIQKIVEERNAFLQQMQMNPPQPPQPQVKVNLTAKLTPEQEAAAAQNAGIGGGNGSGPNGGQAGPGGPAVQPGGHPGPPGQPGVQGHPMQAPAGVHPPPAVAGQR
jgi:hypothetical protein